MDLSVVAKGRIFSRQVAQYYRKRAEGGANEQKRFESRVSRRELVKAAGVGLVSTTAAGASSAASQMRAKLESGELRGAPITPLLVSVGQFSGVGIITAFMQSSLGWRGLRLQSSAASALSPRLCRAHHAYECTAFCR